MAKPGPDMTPLTAEVSMGDNWHGLGDPLRVNRQLEHVSLLQGYANVFPGASLERLGDVGVVLRVGGRVLLERTDALALPVSEMARLIRGDALGRGAAMARSRGVPVDLDRRDDVVIDVYVPDGTEILAHATSISGAKYGKLSTYVGMAADKGTIEASADAVCHFLVDTWKAAGRELPEDGDVLS